MKQRVSIECVYKCYVTCKFEMLHFVYYSRLWFGLYYTVRMEKKTLAYAW